MNLRELLKEMAASSGGGTPGPGPGGDPTPSTPVPTLDSTARNSEKPAGGGQGLSGQGTLKSTGVFIGHETPQEKHDYTAKSFIGKGIEWTKPTGAVSSDEKVYKETELENPGEHHSVGHEGVTEDAEASSTVSGDIATVAYPLFVTGRNKNAKRRAARRAVGQRVAESNLKEFAPGNGGDDDSGDDPYRYPKPESYRRSADYFGKFEADHFDREDMNDATGVFKGYWGKDQIAYFKFNNPAKTGGDDPGMGWYYEPSTAGNNSNAKPAPAVDTSAQRKQQELGMIRAFLKSGNRPSPGSQIYNLMKRHGMAEGFDEAHVVGNDSVIYRLDKENPMSDTEVLVLGGAGRYSLKALRDKARREAAELAQDLSVEHGGAFRRSATNIKQLTNTINTIVAAYNELARLRRKGGRGSRGITDEDTNFIRECIRVVEQATKNYRLMETRAVEPDPKGYAKNKLTNPKYTVVVNTPGDLDWYKIGMYWHDKVVDPNEFGQGDSDTVMVAQGPEDYKQMLAKIKKMGLTYKTIGGTTDQPEIHDKA